MTWWHYDNNQPWCQASLGWWAASPGASSAPPSRRSPVSTPRPWAVWQSAVTKSVGTRPAASETSGEDVMTWHEDNMTTRYEDMRGHDDVTGEGEDVMIWQRDDMMTWLRTWGNEEMRTWGHEGMIWHEDMRTRLHQEQRNDSISFQPPRRFLSDSRSYWLPQQWWWNNELERWMKTTNNDLLSIDEYTIVLIPLKNNVVSSIWAHAESPCVSVTAVRAGGPGEARKLLV